MFKNKPAAQAAGADPSDATQPIGKIHIFCKMAITFEPPMGFLCPSGFRKFLISMT